MEKVRVAEQIRAIAKTGLAYSESAYDLDRYRQLDSLAEALLSDSSGMPKDRLEEAIPFEKGYLTPKVEVRGAVFREGKILMCRERSDGLWALPGGWADIGSTPSENMTREIREETGFNTRVAKLISVFDHDKHEHPKALTHTYKMFFLCDLIGGVEKASFETPEIGFFAHA